MPIEFVDSFSHSGHLITNKFSDSSDILKRRCYFMGQVDNMLYYSCKLEPSVKNRILQSAYSYCTSLYGCELWLLTTNEIGDLCISCRKGLRRVWDLPYTSHYYFLHNVEAVYTSV